MKTIGAFSVSCMHSAVHPPVVDIAARAMVCARGVTGDTMHIIVGIELLCTSLAEWQLHLCSSGIPENCIPHHVAPIRQHIVEGISESPRVSSCCRTPWTRKALLTPWRLCWKACVTRHLAVLWQAVRSLAAW